MILLEKFSKLASNLKVGGRLVKFSNLFVFNLNFICAWLVVCSAILICGSPMVLKFFPKEVLWGYWGVGALCLYGLMLCFKRVDGFLSEKKSLFFVALLYFLFAGIYFLMYGFANSGAVGGGSDNDDAYNLAVRAILKGSYPYKQYTYLGNGVAYFPGAIFLAIPSVLLGNAALQNLFWLIPMLIFLRKFLSTWRAPLFIFLALIFCPTFFQTIVTGSDLIASGCYIFMAFILLVELVRHNAHLGFRIGAIVFIGVALSSRANYLFNIPLLWAALVRLRGHKESFFYIFSIGSISALITFPFYVISPQNFSPLVEQGGKLSQFESILPHASFLIPLVSFLVSITLSFLIDLSKKIEFLLCCSLVQALPLVAVMFLSIKMSGELELWAGVYFFHFIFFSLSAGWLILRQSRV